MFLLKIDFTPLHSHNPISENSHLSNTRTGWNKRLWRAEFFVQYMKKYFYYIGINEQGGGAKTQKSISETARLLDR